MADIKRDAEREELFRTIYKIATDLVHAGHVSEWDFKSYVLGTMFYRYISENLENYINQNVNNGFNVNANNNNQNNNTSYNNNNNSLSLSQRSVFILTLSISPGATFNFFLS